MKPCHLRTLRVRPVSVWFRFQVDEGLEWEADSDEGGGLWIAEMNFLAASSELGTHPATALLLGGIVAACLREGSIDGPDPRSDHRALDRPHHGGGLLLTLSLFGYNPVRDGDRQAKLLAISFIAALVAGISPFTSGIPRRFPALLYAASAVGVAFAGDMLSLFLWWEGLAITSVFQIWGRRTKEAEESGFRYLFFHVSSGLLLLAGIIFRYHGEGADALSLAPLTEALEAGDLGALLILFAVGIKAAFPGLHVWLKDGTPRLRRVRSGCACQMWFACWPGFSGGGGSDHHRRGHGNLSIFYAVIENICRVLCIVNQSNWIYGRGHRHRHRSASWSHRPPSLICSTRVLF